MNDIAPDLSPSPPPMAPPPPRSVEKPQNYLVLAILATLCCCLPTGIVSIIFAAQVDGKWAAGDIAGAQDYAQKAKTWGYASIALGILATLAYFALVAMSAALGVDP